MGNSKDKAASNESRSPLSTNRREFLKLSALGAISAVGTPVMAERLAGMGSRENTMPGRVVICHDPEMDGHDPIINKDLVEERVLQSVCLLTETYDTGAAFESLFPGVHSGSTFALKVNCIGPTCTRWETARGVVSGLSQMLGGTYDVSQVTVYDRHNLHSYGYDESEFTFNGNYPLISHTHNASGSGYYVWESHELSRYLLECDYVIDIPALKSHSDGNNQITVALKNHYGSCSPSSLCGDIPGMLALNTDPNVKDKTGLVITCGLRGTFTGGPGGSPQNWSNYPEQTPNTLLVTTDPVTNEYWARDIINAQRIASGYSQKPCPWIEQASGDPYNIGVSDPDLMTVLNYDLTAVDVVTGPLAGGTFLAPNVPNPFSERTTLRFRLARPGNATMMIVAPTGRIVRHLCSRDFPAGYSDMVWDGRDDRGHSIAAGVYFARLKVGREVRSRRLVVTR